MKQIQVYNVYVYFQVGREHLSEHMRESVEKSGALKNPRKCLIGVRSAENQVMPSHLVAWYISQGMKVKLHRFIQRQTMCYVHRIYEHNNQVLQ